MKSIKLILFLFLTTSIFLFSFVIKSQVYAQSSCSSVSCGTWFSSGGGAGGCFPPTSSGQCIASNGLCSGATSNCSCIVGPGCGGGGGGGVPTSVPLPTCSGGFCTSTSQQCTTISPNNTPRSDPACTYNTGSGQITGFCCIAPTPTGASTPSSTATSTPPPPPPGCGQGCMVELDSNPRSGVTTIKDPCAAARDGCTFCSNQSGSLRAAGKCIIRPTSTKVPIPTPTTAPGCGVDCNRPGDCAAARDGCTACVALRGGNNNNGTRKACEIPVTPTITPVPACGTTCTKPTDCAGAKNGCVICASGVCSAPTPTPTVPACGATCSTNNDCSTNPSGCTQCLPNGNGKTCQQTPTVTPPLACGTTCTKPTDCAGAKNGCTTCNTSGQCAVPACGNQCTTPADCANAKDGCTTCDSSGVCAVPPPACGTTCTKDSQCAGAKNGCSVCTNGACSVPPACGKPCADDSYCINNVSTCTACNLATNQCANIITPPACGDTCTKPTDCAGAKNGCVTCDSSGKCAVPACGNQCSTPGDCASAKDGCTTCNSAGVCAPTAACGNTCTKPSDCASAKDSCTVCDNSGKCAVPACGSACTTPGNCTSAKDGCTTCNSSGQCAVPPTPTPTVFDKLSCTCDGLTYSNLISGQPATFTQYAKVEGANVGKSQVVDETFYLTEGTETTGNKIASSQPIPATIVVNTPSLVRYQSTWNFTLPQLKPGMVYRAWAAINCQPKTTGLNYSANPAKVVLAAQTQAKAAPTSFFGGITNFFTSLFTGTPFVAAPSPTPSPTATIVPTMTSLPTPDGQNTLQLNTFHQIDVISKTCGFIIIRVIK